MFFAGLCLFCLSLPISISMIKSLDLINKHPYTYRLANGLTKETVEVLAFLFPILAIVSIVLMVFGWIKRRNKASLDSIVNGEKQNYCESCKINVSEQHSACPVCGKSLKNKGE